MAFEVTATRRRPQQFDSLAGQEFVVSTLKNAIAQGRIAHAYLFSGPRGVGKTTSARLLAKALNCVDGPTDHPCGECDNCKGIAHGNSLDVIEIDGASNTGVNDVRVIKEEVMFPPVSSRYKIYIIDEVHMLSQSAFNALLKTIEEPPDYVVFIFATTETQKVPATIRSRCQQFNFRLLGIETIQRLLREASDEMGLQAEDEALFWIAKEATGSMRDAYTLFDQVVSFSDGEITLDKIREKLGLVGLDGINAVMLDVLAEKSDGAVTKIQNLFAKGVSTDQLVKDFTDYFRSILLIKHGITNRSVLGHMAEAFPEEVINAYNVEQLEAALNMFLDLYRNIKYSINPGFELELAVSKLVRLKYVASNSTVLEGLAKLRKELSSGAVSAPVQAPSSEISVPVSTAVCKPYSEKEDLSKVLPTGVKETQRTSNGLVLKFENRFYYEFAVKESEKIREKIRQAEGNADLNVIISFSESEAEVKPAEVPTEPEHVPEPATESAVKEVLPQQTELSEVKPVSGNEEVNAEDENKEDEHRYFVDDLMLAFKGYEKK